MVGDGLGWNVGNGRQVHIGADPWARRGAGHIFQEMCDNPYKLIYFFPWHRLRILLTKVFGSRAGKPRLS